MKIGVFGLGYVGIVNVACLGKVGHTVYCTDVKKHKVQNVKSGKSPIMEPVVDELLSQGIANGNIIPTDDVAQIIREADVFLICVGTPSKEDGEVNLNYLNNVVLEISSHLKPDDRKYLIFRSTVPPGTTESIVHKYIKGKYPHVIGVFCPEFLREGSAVKDFFEYGRFVLGVNPSDPFQPLVELLHVNPKSPSFITDYKTAEYAKYIDNGFHALKVAFANEVFGLGAELGVNVEDSHKIFISDDRLNISSKYLRPGTPFGGSCLPKDLRELQHLKKKSDREFFLISSIIPSNESFLKYLTQKIEAFNLKKIAFVGVSFKDYSDDLRESPILKILLKLEGADKYELSIFDDDFNHDTIRVEFPFLFPRIRTLNECMDNCELIVVTKRYLQRVMDLKNAGQAVLNLSDIKTSDVKGNVRNIYCAK